MDLFKFIFMCMFVSVVHPQDFLEVPEEEPHQSRESGAPTHHKLAWLYLQTHGFDVKQAIPNQRPRGKML